MRIPLLRAHVRMLPRLQAEESLLASSRVALGSGSLKADDARQLNRGWSTAAAAGERRAPTTRERHAGLAAAAGIRIVARGKPPA